MTRLKLLPSHKDIIKNSEIPYEYLDEVLIPLLRKKYATGKFTLSSLPPEESYPAVIGLLNKSGWKITYADANQWIIETKKPLLNSILSSYNVTLNFLLIIVSVTAFSMGFATGQSKTKPEEKPIKAKAPIETTTIKTGDKVLVPGSSQIGEVTRISPGPCVLVKTKVSEYYDKEDWYPMHEVSKVGVSLFLGALILTMWGLIKSS